MIEMAGDTLPKKRTPHRLRLGSSGRLSELFCCLLDPERCCVQTVAIAFEHFLLHESDDFRHVTVLQERSQLPLKIAYVGHSGDVLAVTPQHSTPAPRGASLCLGRTRRCQG